MRRAFTLVELLVAIGVIAVLASLGVAVGTGVLARSERIRMESALTLLEESILVMEQTRGQTLTFRRVNKQGTKDVMRFYDITEDPDVQRAYIMPLLLGVLRNNEASASVLAGIDPDLLKSERPQNAPNTAPPITNLRDPWGEQVAVIPCGRSATRYEIREARRLLREGEGTDDADPLDIGVDLNDFTVRTEDERVVRASCDGRRWLFVSNGPDRQFGRAFSEDSSDAPRLQQWEDNVLNYAPVRPNP